MGNVTTDAVRTGDAVSNVSDGKSSSYNRDLIAAFLRSTPDAATVPADSWPGWPDIGEADDFGRQILPGEAGADGFYYAALTKQ